MQLFTPALGFGALAVLLLAAAVLAVVQVGHDFKRMSTAGRITSCVLLAIGFGAVAVLLHDVYVTAHYYDALSWFSALTLAAAAVVAQVWLIVAERKDREAAQHEMQRSPERYQRHALGL